MNFVKNLIMLTYIFVKNLTMLHCEFVKNLIKVTLMCTEREVGVWYYD